MITIRNGTIRDWGFLAVSAGAATDSTIEGVRADNNRSGGIFMGSSSRNEDSSASANTGHGFNAGAGSVILHSTAASNAIATGNMVGPISTDPATAGPWANFDH